MNNTFIDDEEKMRDFYELTKEEFLTSYSYLTEEEYDATREVAMKKYRIYKEVQRKIKDALSIIDDDSTINEEIKAYNRVRAIIDKAITTLINLREV